MILIFTRFYRSWNTCLQLLVLATLFSFNSFGQAGSNDATFMSYTSGINPGFSTFSLLKLIPDGSDKMIAVGGPAGFHRLNADGTIDNSFNAGGTGPGGTITQIEIVRLASKDNKYFIYIKGMYSYNGVDTPSNLARLNLDGTLDTSFNPVLGNDVAESPYGAVRFFKVQPDGKVLVAAPGLFEDSKLAGALMNTTTIIRLDVAGNVDPSFIQGYTPSNIDGNGQTNDLQGFDLQSDGKIIVYCIFGNHGNNSGDPSDPYDVITSNSYAVGTGQPASISSVFRLTSTGAIDATFSASSLSAKGSFAKVQPNDKIIVIDMSKDQETFLIARLNANGSADNTFTSALTFAFTSFINPYDATLIQPDNTLVIMNYSSRKTDRLTGTGAIDTSFNPGTGFSGLAFENSPGSIVRQSDGSYVIAGSGINNYNGNARLSLLRVKTTGSIDGSFINIAYGFTGTVNALVAQPDGKIVVGGAFTNVNGKVANKIARLNVADGATDASFSTGTGFDGSNVAALAYQVIGGTPKIWVGGDFSNYGTNEQHGLARLNATTGAFDDIPGIGTDFGQSVKAITVRDASSLYIGGDFTSYNGVAQRPLILINTAGLKINTFNTPVDFAGTVKAIALQTTGTLAGKVIAGGSSLTQNGTDYPNLMRLNTNGTWDNTFNVGTGTDGDINAIAVLPGDNVLIGGGFYSYNGATAVGLALLDGQTGALLSGFEVDGQVNSIVVQGNTVLVGGQFSSPNANFVRFKLDGTVDTSFDTGAGPNGAVNAIATQSSDNKILIGGFFSSYNGTFRDNLARVNNPTSCAAVTVNPATLLNGKRGKAYNQLLTASGETGAYTFNVSAGTLPGGLTLTTAGVLSGMPTSIGSSMFTVTASTVNGCAGSRAYTLITEESLCAPISITPATLPAGNNGTIYTQTISASGGTAPYTFASTGTLPAGLSLTMQGVLAGTLTSVGSSTFTITASDAEGCTGTRDYTILVNISCAPISFTTATLPAGTVNSVYSQGIIVTGGTAPYSFVTTGTLPAGLSLTTAGVISGTPTSISSSTLTITVTDSKGCPGTKEYTLMVAAACPVISITPLSLPDATVGAAYSQAINASGGAGPYTFSVTQGLLPAGLTLTNSGLLSGTPTLAGNSNFTVTATSNGCSGLRSFTTQENQAFCINPARPVITLNATNPAALVLSSSSNSGNQWYFNSALIVGATNQSFTVASVEKAGIYTVKVTADNCSSETSAPQVIVVTGDVENTETELIVFPNPVKDKLIIRLNGFGKSKSIDVMVNDMTGKRLAYVSLNNGEDVVLDMSDYAPGNYIISIMQGGLVKRRHFIKQ